MQRMWGVKKVFSFMFLALMVFALLIACGGGGGGSDGGGGNNNQTPPPNTNATITGTVAGTTVKAFDLSGNEVASNTATGNPKTFTLNVPAGGSYKFYLIENEGTSSERVYALYQGNTNVFNIASAVTINLGFVSTATGVAVPANNPLNVSGVTSGGENTAIPSPLVGSAFSLADLQGTWNFHGLISGDSPAETPGWYWGSFTADSAGTVTSASTITDSLGNSSYTPSLGAFNISTSGIVTNPGAASYRGVMNKNKDMIVATATMAPGASTGVSGYNLQIFLKSGGTFTLSDLQGTWNSHALLSGDSPSQRSGWSYSTASVDSSGNYTESSHTRSNGGTGTNTFTFAITADGIVTINGFSTFHGVMSQDKNMIVGTHTDGDGGYGLIIFQKSGGTFSQSDLTGTWNLHGLTSGDNPPQWIGWFYAGTSIDSSGNLASSFCMDSSGDTACGGDVMFSISSTGEVTEIGGNLPDFHSVMNQNKDIIVGTMTGGGGGYDLMIFMK